MDARRNADLTALRTDLAALRAELLALRSEVHAARPADPAPADDLTARYAAWRSGPLVRLGKALARRAPQDAPAVRWRGAAMRAVCLVLLDPAHDAAARHQGLSEAVTTLLGDTGWRNDADLIRVLIETRDAAAALSPADWAWPADDGLPVDPARHEVLPGSTGDHVALVVAPALRSLPALIVAG